MTFFFMDKGNVRDTLRRKQSDTMAPSKVLCTSNIHERFYLVVVDLVQYPVCGAPEERRALVSLIYGIPIALLQSRVSIL